jgi:hypothetical protein
VRGQPVGQPQARAVRPGQAASAQLAGRLARQPLGCAEQGGQRRDRRLRTQHGDALPDADRIATHRLQRRDQRSRPAQPLRQLLEPARRRFNPHVGTSPHQRRQRGLVQPGQILRETRRRHVAILPVVSDSSREGPPLQESA